MKTSSEVKEAGHRTDVVGFQQYEVPSAGKFKGRGGRVVAARGRGNGELVFNGDRISVQESEHILERDGVTTAQCAST